jgi:hypothetical protein
MIHSDVEVEHHEDRRLQPVSKIKGLGAELEAFGGAFREQQNVLGVAVRGVSTRRDIALLGSGRHSGRGACTLYVE